jgi:hypothetical protein
MFVLTLLNFINDVTIDHKKQAGLKVQTPVTDLEAILEQAECHLHRIAYKICANCKYLHKLYIKQGFLYNC